MVTELGTYDCRILNGTDWSVWSPIPVVIKTKTTVTQPSIKVSGLASRHIPAPDGSTGVTLEVNSGFEAYNWQQEGDATIRSTSPFYTATAPGFYKVQITDKFSCQKNTFRIEAEDYSAMLGVAQETTQDFGGGLNVGSIDLNEYMDYTINIATTGTYTFTGRVAAASSGAQFQVRDVNGTTLATLNVPNTGSEEVWTEVNAAINLPSGIQTLRLYSTASRRWDINYFQLTGSNIGNFSNAFTVVSADGPDAPPPISNLGVNVISKSSLQLTWSQSSNPAFNETGFEVYQALEENGPYKLVAITAANATGITFNNLSAGTQHFYKVRAVNNTGASAVSAPSFAFTTSDTTPPTAPINLTLGSIAKSSVYLSWSAATDDVGVVRYDLYIDGIKTYSTTARALYAYNLVPNTTYSFVVKARDLAGNSSPSSNTVSAKTSTGTITADPGMSPAVPGNYSVYLNMNTDNPAGSPWNNMNILPSAGVVSGNLRSYAGLYTGTRMTIVDNFSGYHGAGMNTGTNSGVYPDNVIRSAYYNDRGNVAKIRIDGLSLIHKYSFIFFGSIDQAGDRSATYTIGTQDVSLNASKNITNTVQIDNVTPDINGSVTIEISIKPGAALSFLNSLVIKGYKTNGSVGNQPPVVSAGADKSVTLPTSSVSLLGSASDGDGSIVAYNWSKTSGPAQFNISDPSAASTTISNLTEGIYTFRLTATDNGGASAFDEVQVAVGAAVVAGARLVKVNLYGGANAYNNPEWNNWNVSSSLSSGALKYSDATASSVSAALSSSGGVNDNGSTYGSGMAPAEVLRYTSNATVQRTLTLSGLSMSKVYSLELYGSRDNYSGNHTVFTVNGVSQSISTYRNFTGKASFTDLTPNASGQIVVTIKDAQTYNYLNGFTLTEMEGTPPPPPPAGTNYVKVNLYGGTNPYNNPEWNNWNVSSSLSSGALKYSDATASSINALLSSSGGVNDNGSAYGNGMAPAEVLRYASNATVQRTLTIGGLYAGATYSLELYGSRNNYSGNHTVFTVNGVNQSISTYRNFTGKASFTGLTPNASGQIVVTIQNSQSYNYINGFTLTENVGSSQTLTLSNASVQGALKVEDLSSTLQMNAFPNPASHQFSLHISSTQDMPVYLRIYDVAGRIVEQKQNLPSNTRFTLGEQYQVGIYYAEVIQGGEKIMTKLIKTSK